MTDEDKTPIEIAAADGSRQDIEALIRRVAADLLDTSAMDLQAFSSRLATQLLYANSSGNVEVRESVARQARLLAEAQRIRATDAAWSTFYSIVTEATSVAVGVATRLLTSGAVKIAP